MNQNQFLTLIFLLLVGASSYSQEVSVSKILPESENTFIGFWGSKALSYRVQELIIVDTASATPTKQVVKIGPQIEGVDRIGSVHYFIHDHFLYEFSFVIPKIRTGVLEGYNVIVKRDLETMQIVTQKRLEHLHSQMKFVKCFDDGFYFCFGRSYSLVSGSYNIFYESPAREVTPMIVYSFNYNLDEIWSMKMSSSLSYSPLMNDISFDGEYLLIPTAFRDGTGIDGAGRFLNLTIADLKEKIADVTLKFDLEKSYTVHSVKVKFDEAAKKYRAFLLISKQDEKKKIAFESGYMYLNWDEKGHLLESGIHHFSLEEMFHANDLKLKKTDFNYYFTAYQVSNQTDVLYFDILENGDAICAVNNICRDSDIKSLRHSKFVCRISKDGSLQWSQFIPYNEDLLYINSFCLMQEEMLHIYTREDAKKFNGGSESSKGNGSVLMTDRAIDLKTGDMISHKSILDQSIGDFNPEWFASQFNPEEYIIRYRQSRKNSEKFVFMQF